MTGARCRILASSLAGDVMRCPTTPYRFHYHGVVSGGQTVAILTGSWPCDHRHQTEAGARDCTTRSAGGRPPIRLSDVRRARARRI